MKHKIYILLLIVLIVNISCKSDKNKTTEDTKENVSHKFDDGDYVLNADFPFGDARRYGLTPKDVNKKHPFTKKNRLETVLDIAEQSGEEITIPEGYYKTNLVLNTRSDIKLKFNSSEFSLIHIVQPNDTVKKPSNISLKGSITSYASLGIINAENIKIDTLYLKSDAKKNLWGLRNAGLHMYKDCKNISIDYLEIQDLGSGSDKYKNAHAALVIDGGKVKPSNVQIKKVHIKSTDRHGVYLNGRDHLIGEIIIDKFGVGSSNGMSGMIGAKKGEEKDFKALWINHCYDTFIEKVTINEKGSKGKYTAHFDTGKKDQPVTIGLFKVLNDNPNITILEEEKNGVVIESKE